MSRMPATSLAQLPPRPRPVSIECAEAEMLNSVREVADSEFQKVYIEKRWQFFSSQVSRGDQVWLFETSGRGVQQRKGLALERRGWVINILVFP